MYPIKAFEVKATTIIDWSDAILRNEGVPAVRLITRSGFYEKGCAKLVGKITCKIMKHSTKEPPLDMESNFIDIFLIKKLRKKYFPDPSSTWASLLKTKE